MSHYDCRDCGAYQGIAYGYCDSCTPKRVLELKEKITKERKEAGHLWDHIHRDERSAFVDNRVERLIFLLKIAYDANNRYDRDYTRLNRIEF